MTADIQLTELFDSAIASFKQYECSSRVIVYLRSLKQKYKTISDEALPISCFDDFLQFGIISDFVKNIIETAIINSYAGLTLEELIEVLPAQFSSRKIYSFVQFLIDNNILTLHSSRYIISARSVNKAVKDIANSHHRFALYSLFQGKSMSEISHALNLHDTQKAYSLVSDAMAVLIASGEKYSEDRYKEIYTTYALNSSFFTNGLLEPASTYYYLKFRYTPGKKSVDKILSEDNLPEVIKNAATKQSLSTPAHITTKVSKSDNFESLISDDTFDKKQFQRLKRKITRDFDKKFYIGDIVITDVEYKMLMVYAKSALNSMISRNTASSDSPILAVALVQIGLHHYDGRYWPHAEHELNTKISSLGQHLLGMSFIHTLRAHSKHILNEYERVASILFHGFVSDYYSKGLMELLFQYYANDLDRDIYRNTAEQMKSLMDTLAVKAALSDADSEKFTDQFTSKVGSKAYKLKHHTLQAISANPSHSSMRLRRILRLIDKAFWNETLPKNPSSRITILFKEWVRESPSFQRDYNLYKLGEIRNRGKKHFSSPYIFAKIKDGRFCLKLPSQIVREESILNLEWEIKTAKGTRHTAVNAYPVLSGYKTEDCEIDLSLCEVFGDIQCDLLSNQVVAKSFGYIRKSDVRFFDMDGDYAPKLFKIPMCAFTCSGYSLASQALLDRIEYGHLIRWDFDFEQGDIVVLPDGSSMIVGERYVDGLMPRGIVNGVHYIADNQSSPINIYSKLPFLLITIPKLKIPGTIIDVNGVQHRLSDCKYSDFDSKDSKGTRAFVVPMDNFNECKNQSLNTVILDIPGYIYAKKYEFVYIKDFFAEFDGSPYIFEERGTVRFPKQLKISCNNFGVQSISEENSLGFELNPDLLTLDLQIDNLLSVSVDIPMLIWSADGNDWHTEPMGEIWHSDFFKSNKLFFRSPIAKLELCTDSDYDDDEASYRSITAESCGNGLYSIDLARFKSWLTRDRIRHTLILKIGTREINFAYVFTRSFVGSCELSADYDCGVMKLYCEAVGKADYYVDITHVSTGNMVKEKFNLTSSSIEFEDRLLNGSYKVEVFEAEEDDSGFDDIYYMSIYSKDTLLINKNDLSGKHLYIKRFRPVNSGLFTELHSDYWVRDLERVAANTYKGELIASGRNLNIITQVFFPIENDLRNFVLSFWDDYEDAYIDFLYDSQQKLLVTEELPGLKRSVRYRRYKCLFDTDYLFFGGLDDIFPSFSD